MLEFRSALDGHIAPGRFGAATASEPLILSERPLGTLVQVSGWRDSFEGAAAPLLRRLGFAGVGNFASAQSVGEAVAFRVAPERILLNLASPAAWEAVVAGIDQAVTPTLDLSHARTVVRVGGPAAAGLLARLLPIDFDDSAFGPGRFVQSALHSVGVLAHRRTQSVPCFDVYIPSSYAVTVWEMITHNAASFGYEVRGAG
jgi:sarcosine oxidase subunit gamma